MSDSQDRSTQAVIDVLTLTGEAKTKMDPQKMLAVNELAYIYQPQLSAVKERRVEKQMYTSNNYSPGDIMSITMSTGNRFVLARNSFLQFQAYNPGNQLIFLQQNGAYAFFQASVVTSNSGVELCRIDNFLNYWNMIKLLRKDRGQSLSKDLAGCPTISATLVHAYPDRRNPLADGSYGTTDNKYFSPVVTSILKQHGRTTSGALTSALAPLYQIPLSDLNPIFDTDQPLPYQVISGLRLDLTLAQANSVCVTGHADAAGGDALTSATYSIVNPSIITDNLYLAEAFQEALLAVAAKGGLEMEFSGITSQSFYVQSSSPQLNTQRALAHVKQVIVAQFETPQPTVADECKYDTFICDHAKNNITGFQFNVGSEYYPNHFVTQTGTNNREELYRLGCKHPLKLHDTADLTYQRWGGSVADLSGSAVTVNVSVNPVLAYDLMRSPKISHSGVSLNSAKNLTLNFTRSTADAATYIMYIVYSLGLEIFSDGRIIVRS